MTDTTPRFDARQARRNIEALLDREGKSSFYMSEQIGRNRTYIDDFLREKKKTLPYKEVVLLAEKLAVHPDYIAGMRSIEDGDDIDIFLPSWTIEHEEASDNWLNSSPVKWNGSRIVATTEDDPYHFKLTVEIGPRSFSFAEKHYHIPSWAKLDAMSKFNVSAEGIPELDVTLQEIGYPLPVRVFSKGRVYQPGVVIDIWDIPQRYISGELKLDTKYIDIIRIDDNSMSDPNGLGYSDGDRILIDRSDCNVRKGGVFCLTDQDTTLIRQIEFIRTSQPEKIRCLSFNSKFEDFEAILGVDVKIIGRVVLKIGKPR